MPFYSLKKISAAAESRPVYLRGVHGYNAGWVRAYTESTNVFYPCYITAGVEEDGKSYAVEIGFDSAGELEYGECTCGQFHPKEGVCKHIVAVLVHKYYQDMVTQLPTAAALERMQERATDPAARQMIDRYMADETRRMQQTGAAEPVALTPLLALEAGRPVLRFAVGNDRPYLLKNLARFAERMQQGETAEYGKQLTLYHHPDSFRPDSRPVLDLLLAEWNDRPAGMGAAAGELPLSAAGFDRFFALMEGRPLTLRTATGDRTLQLIRDNPRLTVSLVRERSGVRVTGEEMQPIRGLHTLYLLRGDRLFAADADYTRRMTGLVQVLSRAPEGVYISAGELPAFCAGVWRTVERYLLPEGDTGVLAAYRPRPLEARIYLDAPEPGCITARVEYHYGEDILLPFAGAAGERQPWQDPLGEEQVKAALLRQFTALQPDTGLLVLRGDDGRLFRFLTEGVAQLRQVATVYASDRYDRMSPAAPVRLQVGISLLGDLLQVELDAADWEPADLTGIMEGYRRHDAYHRLQDGRFVALDDPALRALCVVGDAAARQTLLEQTVDYDVLLTSYDLLKRDVALYRGLEFHYHILDEAQYIKNSSTQNAKAVKAIRSAQRFALTGTPVENRLSELWSIFDFLMPGLLFRYSRFRERFETPIVRQGDEQALTQLSRMTAPFILRRLKRDVLTELPEKTERLLPATMENAQRQVYRDTMQELRRQLEDSRDGQFSGQSRMTALALLTRLRQICCDPRLCCEGYTGESCKLEACVELLKEAAAGGHKVLLFSQFTSMLALIRQRLEEEQIGCYVLQGSTSKEQRAALVDAFNRDDTPVFLISLKAGGTGLNLTGADMVIHYDPWWNLSAQNQATDRAHRIGQKNPVQVVRLVVRDTVEEKILRMQEDKWRLAEAVVTADGPSIASLSAEELLTLLTD